MQTTTKQKGRDSGKSAVQTTGVDHTALTLQAVKEEPRIDSRVLTQHLGNTHQHVRGLLPSYTNDFRQLGILRFQIGKPPAGSMGARPERYAMLNEDQAYLLLTYSRNIAKVRALKVRLVLAFLEVRQAQDVMRTEYLPTYHALHDEIHVLAGQSKNERFVHTNVNQLVNKAVSISAGERGRLDAPRHAHRGPVRGQHGDARRSKPP